jgi:hypothetical protein
LPFLPPEPAGAGDLIRFLKALPDCRMRRGIRFPQWWMLLVAILAILSNEGSLAGMELSDSSFRVLLWQLDVGGLETLLRDGMAAQPGVAEGFDAVVTGGKTLHGSIDEHRDRRSALSPPADCVYIAR